MHNPGLVTNSYTVKWTDTSLLNQSVERRSVVIPIKKSTSQKCEHENLTWYVMTSAARSHLTYINECDPSCWVNNDNNTSFLSLLSSWYRSTRLHRASFSKKDPVTPRPQLRLCERRTRGEWTTLVVGWVVSPLPSPRNKRRLWDAFY